MIRGTSTGYCVDVPDLPGCIAAAKTMKKVRRLIAEAIGLHLELMEQHGEPIPPPRLSIEFAIEPDETDTFCTWVEVLVPEPIST